MAGSKEPNDFEAHGSARRGALVYLPCPGCRQAVLLSDETRVAEDPETYECPRCEARFILEPG